MEAHRECFDSVRSVINKKSKDNEDTKTDDADKLGSFKENSCMKNSKRSAKEDTLETETVVVIKKRGNKVFIEI